MKKLLFFINTLNGGGAEKVLSELVCALPRDKYQITLVTMTGGINEDNLPNSIEYRRIIKTDNRYITKLLYTYYVKLMSASKFYKKFIAGDYDDEIAFLEGFNTKVISCSDSRAEKIAFVHINFEKQYGLESVYGDDANASEIYSRFDKIAFVSLSAKIGFEKKFGDIGNRVVVHNIINPDKIRALSCERQDIITDTKAFNIVSVGRLAAQKGYDRLLESIYRLNGDGFCFKVYIIGDGPDKEKLIAYAEEKGISNVSFVPFQKNPYSVVAKADLFICSSREEGYSTAVSEAAVLGVPVVTTDCAGMDEIFDNGKYALITPNSTEGIYGGLRQVLESKEKMKELEFKANERKNFYSLGKCIGEFELVI